MKNITYGLLGLLLMLTSVGQAQTYDVGITNIINPANGSTIQATAQPLIFTVKNFGSALLASDTVWLSIKVDGVTLPINAPRPVAAFASGDSNNLQINLPQFASFTPGSHTICVKTSLTSKTDAVTSNDEFCSTFTVVLPDLGVSAVEIITPAKNDGDTIRTNETVSSIRVTVQNNGAQPYITTPIAIVLDINGSTQNLSLPLNAAIPAGGTVAGNIPSNLIPAQPTSVGSYKVCAYTALTNDADNTNDTNCVTLVVLDPATPAPTITSFAPPKGAVGTDVTINGTGFSATAANNTVKFNGTVATVKSATATQIVATVPTGATTGKVTVKLLQKQLHLLLISKLQLPVAVVVAAEVVVPPLFSTLQLN